MSSRVSLGSRVQAIVDSLATLLSAHGFVRVERGAGARGLLVARAEDGARLEVIERPMGGFAYLAAVGPTCFSGSAASAEQAALRACEVVAEYKQRTRG